MFFEGFNPWYNPTLLRLSENSFLVRRKSGTVLDDALVAVVLHSYFTSAVESLARILSVGTDTAVAHSDDGGSEGAVVLSDWDCTRELFSSPGGNAAADMRSCKGA